jgi:hypothetical protein
MSTWRPATEGEIWDLINRAWTKMSLPQRRVWEAIKVDPMKWHENTYGKMGGGFWVVALYGSTVVWYNDIENGFNQSTWTTPGTIDEYWCNQSELQDLIGERLEATPSAGRCGPPQSIG